MVTHERWLQAQEAEGDFWRDVCASRSEFLRIAREKVVAAEFLVQNAPEFFARHAQDKPSAYEVGIGALGLGVMSFLPGVERWHLVGLEPQERLTPELGPLLNPVTQALASLDYTHLVGPGEEAPLPDGAFDLAVCYNVLEHVQDPLRIVREMRRVLRPDGLALIGENCLSLLGYIKKRHLSRVRDLQHPHSLTISRLTRLLESAGLQVFHRDPVRREWQWALAGRFKRRLLLARPV